MTSSVCDICGRHDNGRGVKVTNFYHPVLKTKSICRPCKFSNRTNAVAVLAIEVYKRRDLELSQYLFSEWAQKRKDLAAAEFEHDHRPSTTT